jgi:integrase
MTTSKGGRPATGSARWRFNPDRLDPVTGKPAPGFQWWGRITKEDKSRPWAPLDPSILEHEEERARVCAVETAAYYRANPHVGDAVRETTSEWFKRFHAHKEKLGLSTVVEMRGRYKKWAAPEIGGKAPVSVTAADLERIVRRLDRAITAWTKAGGKRGSGLSPSTAANVWGDVVHGFDEMVRAKDAGLRCLTRSPCENVRGPEGGDDREGQILYSDEIVALLRGVPVDPEDRPVPLYRRQCYAMALYTKARASELKALTAADIDVKHATIEIDKQADRKSKGRAGNKRTKTRKKRTIDIELHLLPLIDVLVKHPQGKGGRILRVPPPEDLAEKLRADLLTVGVTRKALHVSDELERAIAFHDLRDTGLCHMAVRGDPPILIQWTGGHSDFKTTQGYIDRGRVERQRIGAPLPPLPPELLPPPPEVAEDAHAEPDPVGGAPSEDTPTGLDQGLDLAELAAETSYVSAMLGRSQRELNCTKGGTTRKTPEKRARRKAEGGRPSARMIVQWPTWSNA